MSIIILISSRIIKLVANLTKILSYLFHFLFPGKRFTLPERAGPLVKWKSGNRAIPRTVWQTNYTHKVTLPVYLNYWFNRLMCPSFEYRFMVTEARAEFIKSHYPDEVFHAYSRLQIGAAQADFWRLLVLQKHGGVYLDIDAHVVWPLELTVKPAHQELYLIRQRHELTNYFIASKSGNPNLERLIQRILTNIDENRIKEVYGLTGPNVFNQELDYRTVPTTFYRYTCSQGNFTNEYFQYLDKPEGKWNIEQYAKDVVRDDTSAQD